MRVSIISAILSKFEPTSWKRARRGAVGEVSDEDDERREKKKGASFSRAPATDAREREVGDRRPDGDPAGVRSVLRGEGRTLSALKNFCSSHAVHLVSLGFLSPAGRWMEKKWRQKKIRSRNLPTCLVRAVARGGPRERELARRSPRIDRDRCLDENEPDGDPVARARATTLVRLPRECGFVQNRVLKEDEKMHVERKYGEGRPGEQNARAPRDFPRRLAPKTSLNPSSTLQTTSDEKTFATSHRSCAMGPRADPSLRRDFHGDANRRRGSRQAPSRP